MCDVHIDLIKETDVYSLKSSFGEAENFSSCLLDLRSNAEKQLGKCCCCCCCIWSMEGLHSQIHIILLALYSTAKACGLLVE